MLEFFDELLKAADDLVSPTVMLFSLLDDDLIDEHHHVHNDISMDSDNSSCDDVFDLLDDDID